MFSEVSSKSSSNPFKGALHQIHCINYYTLVYRFIKHIRILKVLRTFGRVSTLVEVLESVQLGFDLISTSLFEPLI